MPTPMLQAVALAGKAKGQTAPNPCVGAVLTRDGQIVAQGWHQGPGQAHAEVAAITQARELGLDLTELTLWVTLEPCNHFGRTPPCTQAIIQAGISRVKIGTLDPNPEVAGGGAHRLRAHGVQVESGIEEQACLDLIRDFVAWSVHKRPFVQLKLASTLDGRIATRTGDSAWVTGEEARDRVHGMRSKAQAVLVGGGTLYADDPRLTCRGHNVAAQPLAVLVSSQVPPASTPLSLFHDRPQEVVLWTSTEQAETEAAAKWRERGVRVWPLPWLEEAKGLDLKAGLQRLFRETGCWNLLCEGGGRLGLNLMLADMVDEFHLVLAPKVLGDDRAVSVLAGRSLQRMDQALNWRLTSHEQVGQDIWLVYQRPGIHLST